MSSISPSRETRDIPVIHVDEVSSKPAPILEVGAIAWIRQNLFKTWLDTLLTILSMGLIFVAISAAIHWVVGEARWYIVIFNIRQFMMGRLEPHYQGRVQFVLFLFAFVGGFALAAYSRATRRFAIILTIIIAVLLIVPLIVQATIDMPPAYFTAANIPLESGSDRQIAQDQIAFIGTAGDEISLRVASELGIDDAALATLHGFADKAGNLLRAAADNRITAQNRTAEINDELAGDALTGNQRDQLTAELERLTIPDSPIPVYSLNEQPVVIHVLRGTTLEVVAEGQLMPGGESLTFTLPEDGWYVLEKMLVEGDAALSGATLIEVRGIYPLLQRLLVPLGDNGQAVAGARSEQFVRMTDQFLTEEARPTIDGTALPMADIIDNQYRGLSPLRDYLRLYLAPFLNKINWPIALVALLAAAGYFVARGLDRQFSPVEVPRSQSRTIATYMVFIAPLVAFIALYTLPPIGVALIFVSILDYALYRLLPLLDKYGILKPKNELWRLILRLIVAFGVSFLISWLLLLPLYNWLNNTAIPDIYPVTNTRLWGGLMLTVFLATSGIVLSFPLGILLALGRRSSLPVVSTICTLYIEFVRGVPLITVLFMSQLLIPLVNPALADIPGAFRAMIAIVLFSAAYLAENVRGGLQSIQPGQIEAAKALNLSTWQISLFVTLPQALRAVIPALVGQFISLFKDTSLVAIVGLIDLAGIAETVYAQDEFYNLRRETYFLVTLIYFSFCFGMAYLSRRIERTGSGVIRKQQI